ncbi:hypothetical protein Gohar_005476 [Gossypium harknessii]|uniref:EF-hand domain-containing protein n=1 Tax=Gossypium harknessii TaxID=34285 RepID=A0A7J9H831_9ROSI|nr:hypothetical protein [Gossypium harknessii]
MNDKQPAKLDEEQMAELRETFPSFDRSNDDQVEALIQKADSNNNGLVEFSEFATMVAPELLSEKSPYSEEQLRRLFKMFDTDGNGFIKAAELAHSMAKLGNALTVEELSEMIKEADTDGDGRMSLEKFSHAIISAAFEF